MTDEATVTMTQLVSEHEEIGLLCRELSSLCGASAVDHQRVNAILMLLAQKVEAHLKHEDRAVCSRLRMRFAGSRDVDPAGFRAHFVQLRLDCQTYFRRWTETPPSDDWGAFRADTNMLIGQLQERMRIEAAFIYPLAYAQWPDTSHAEAPAERP